MYIKLLIKKINRGEGLLHKSVKRNPNFNLLVVLLLFEPSDYRTLGISRVLSVSLSDL